MSTRPKGGKALPVLESVRLADLKPHPRNYRTHPDDEIEEIQASIREHGWYRNIVIARDDTILAGHGVVQAAIGMGRRVGPAIRLRLDPLDPRALKVLVSDNELPRRAESDDRALTELLRDLAQDDVGLLGTGYNDEQLAALTMVTRHAHEISDKAAAAEWVGMPEFEAETAGPQLVITCDSEEDRDALLELMGNPTIRYKRFKSWSLGWPDHPREDLMSVRFEAGEADG